ncbi:MAG: IS110 family transposase, partial [Thermodesulfovibrionales bacterium]
SVRDGLSNRISVNPSEVLVVMEATGVYHLRLACGLYEMGYAVAVVNPFVIKKYAEMKLKRVKTDPVDSRLIAEYARDNAEGIRLFKAKQGVLYEIEVKIRILDDLLKSLKAFENQRHAISYYPVKEEITRPYDEIIGHIKQQIKAIEGELEELIERNFKRQYKLLMSIPGVGKKLAWVVVGVLKGFEDFESARQVSSYIGICPEPWESGKVVKRGKLSRKGSGFIRRILYLCAWSASRFNRDCKELYERLLMKGKSKKVAIVAVANKLIRQAFGVLRNNRQYVPSFHLHRKSLCNC